MHELMHVLFELADTLDYQHVFSVYSGDKTTLGYFYVTGWNDLLEDSQIALRLSKKPLNT